MNFEKSESDWTDADESFESDDVDADGFHIVKDKKKSKENAEN